MASRRKYEGSKADIVEDRRGVKKLGKSLKSYERTRQDKVEDRRGQSRLAKRLAGRVI